MNFKKEKKVYKFPNRKFYKTLDSFTSEMFPSDLFRSLDVFSLNFLEVHNG